MSDASKREPGREPGRQTASRGLPRAERRAEDLADLRHAELDEELARLEELRLHSPHLDTLPPALFALKELRALELAMPLRELPAGLAQRTALEHLDLRATEIRELPEWLKVLPRLAELRHRAELVSADERVRLELLLPQLTLRFD